MHYWSDNQTHLEPSSYPAWQYSSWQRIKTHLLLLAHGLLHFLYYCTFFLQDVIYLCPFTIDVTTLNYYYFHVLPFIYSLALAYHKVLKGLFVWASWEPFLLKSWKPKQTGSFWCLLFKAQSSQKTSFNRKLQSSHQVASTSFWPIFTHLPPLKCLKGFSFISFPSPNYSAVCPPRSCATGFLLEWPSSVVWLSFSVAWSSALALWIWRVLRLPHRPAGDPVARNYWTLSTQPPRDVLSGSG